jgi:hypothetical protein
VTVIHSIGTYFWQLLYQSVGLVILKKLSFVKPPPPQRAGGMPVKLAQIRKESKGLVGQLMEKGFVFHMHIVDVVD